MYEIEDYEDKISKHRKILWATSFLVFLGYLVCALYAFLGASTVDCESSDKRRNMFEKQTYGEKINRIHECANVFRPACLVG